MFDADNVSVPSISTSSYVLPDGPTGGALLLTTKNTDDKINNPPSPTTRSSAEKETDVAVRRKTLKFALPATEEGGHTRYAIVPFPQTYEVGNVWCHWGSLLILLDKAAVHAAIRVLGQYMTDPRPENVILACSAKNRKGDWIWADMEPEHWKLVLGDNEDEVGVFENRRKDIARDLGFLHGKVHLTIADTQGTKTVWRDLNSITESIRKSNRANASDFYTIDRPKNYTVSYCVRILPQLTSEIHR
jgi:hypothetical protein